MVSLRLVFSIISASLGLTSLLNLLNRWALGLYGLRFPLIMTACHMIFGSCALAPLMFFGKSTARSIRATHMELSMRQRFSGHLLHKSGARVILLLTHASSGNNVLMGAFARGRSCEDCLWLGSSSSIDQHLHSSWEAAGLHHQDMLRLMRGFIGVFPSMGNTDTARSLLKRLDAVLLTKSDRVNCSLRADGTGCYGVSGQESSVPCSQSCVVTQYIHLLTYVLKLTHHEALN